MIFENRKFVGLVFVTFLFMPIMEAAGQANAALPAADQMTIWRARRIFNNIAEYRETRHLPRIDRSSFRITQDSIEFDVAKAKAGTRQHYSIDLRALEPVSVICKDHHGLFCQGDLKTRPVGPRKTRPRKGWNRVDPY